MQISMNFYSEKNAVKVYNLNLTISMSINIQRFNSWKREMGFSLYRIGTCMRMLGILLESWHQNARILEERRIEVLG